jgi:hypothetical protein
MAHLRHTFAIQAPIAFAVMLVLATLRWARNSRQTGLPRARLPSSAKSLFLLSSTPLRQ